MGFLILFSKMLKIYQGDKDCGLYNKHCAIYCLNGVQNCHRSLIEIAKNRVTSCSHTRCLPCLF